MKNSLFIFLIFCCFISNPAQSKTETRKEKQRKNDSKNSGFIFIPALYYTPETKIAGGVSVIYYYRNSGSLNATRPSTIQPTFIYTQKNQIISSLSTDLYFKEETYRFTGNVTFKKFPDKFYGIGSGTPKSLEEDFTPRTFELLAQLQKKIRPGLSVGLLYEFSHIKITEIETNGLLAQGNILGAERARVSGVGLVVNFDTRDNIFYPTSGSYHQFTASFFGSALGGNFQFNRYSVDLRKYFPLAGNVFAGQLYMNFLDGSPPFQILSQLGGEKIMRGYYQGRYRDKHILVLQTEYRMKIWRRFGLAGFVGLGDVADELNRFDLGNFNLSIGLGLRYLYSRAEGINVRIDIGFSGGTPGPYITINEAF